MAFKITCAPPIALRLAEDAAPEVPDDGIIHSATFGTSNKPIALTTKAGRSPLW